MNQSRSTVLVLILLLFIVAILPLSAQNFTADARLVAMGGTGGHANDALRFAGEYRLTIFEFRGGTHYKNKDWQPTGGVGVNIASHFGSDAAIYGTATNIERKRKAALALSLRLGGS